MRAVLQRVARATVRVDGGIVSEIGQGLLILLGVAASDGPQEADWMTGKLVGLRVFENTDGRLDRSVVEVGGGSPRLTVHLVRRHTNGTAAVFHVVGSTEASRDPI